VLGPGVTALSTPLRDAAVIRKFGALKAEDCLAQEQAAEEMEE
jgi:hypothetical protein